MAGKAPGEVIRACRRIGVRCVLFGGRVLAKPAGADVRELSGRPRQARADLVRLGEELALLL
jgi:hypothetical protein